MKDALMGIGSILSGMKAIDLSHVLEEDIPAWPTHPKFYLNVAESYDKGDLARHYQLQMSEHSGTHCDAPLHFVRRGKAHYGIDRVPLETFFGRCATIGMVNIGKNGLVKKDDISGWEKCNGEIQAGDIVNFYFGWDRFWGKKPEGAEFLKDWPGLSKEAAVYLTEKKVKAVGTDALALDSFDTVDHPAHFTLLENEILIFENLNNLGLLPVFSYFFAFPLKILEGSGSPTRAVAFAEI